MILRTRSLSVSIPTAVLFSVMMTHPMFASFIIFAASETVDEELIETTLNFITFLTKLSVMRCIVLVDLKDLNLIIRDGNHRFFLNSFYNVLFACHKKLNQCMITYSKTFPTNCRK